MLQALPPALAAHTGLRGGCARTDEPSSARPLRLGGYRAGSSGELIRVACVRCPLLAAHCVGHGGFSGWEGGQPALLARGCPTLRHRTTASPIRLPRPAQHGNVSADRRTPVGYSRVRTLGYSRVLSGPLGYSRVLSGTLGHCRVLAGTLGATHSGTLGYCEGRVLPEIGAVGSREIYLRRTVTRLSVCLFG